MAKYLIEVAGSKAGEAKQFPLNGIFEGGKTIATARKRGQYFSDEAPEARVTIIRPTTYKDVNYNPYEERYAFVEEVSRGIQRDPQRRQRPTRTRFAYVYELQVFDGDGWYVLENYQTRSAAELAADKVRQDWSTRIVRRAL